MIQFGLESSEVQEEAKMKHARGGGKRQDDIIYWRGMIFME